ncbi:MAG TPA: alpha/beta hydrolase, partial [Polyangiales bacterium]|nr:alpha/beta hydrolase [Polyangiales bacterium]
GGSAATRYAGTHPERVAGLMLVGTPGKAAPDKAQQTLAALNTDYQKTIDGYWQRLIDGAKPEVADRVITDGKKVGRDAAMAMIDATFAYDPLPSLAAYTGPKLLVDTPHGESPDSLHSEQPEIRQVMITGTSHWPQMDKPEEFNAVLDEFVSGVEKAK